MAWVPRPQTTPRPEGGRSTRHDKLGSSRRERESTSSSSPSRSSVACCRVAGTATKSCEWHPHDVGQRDPTKPWTLMSGRMLEKRSF